MYFTSHIISLNLLLGTIRLCLFPFFPWGKHFKSGQLKGQLISAPFGCEDRGFQIHKSCRKLGKNTIDYNRFIDLSIFGIDYN